jgi:hypothetical protein
MRECSLTRVEDTIVANWIQNRYATLWVADEAELAPILAVLTAECLLQGRQKTWSLRRSFEYLRTGL